jgi:AcrR family transcriptional regulator
MATARGRTNQTHPVGRRLGRADWTEAALAAIGEGGVAAVVVETLAERLGATKGSFYWHFRDRGALVEAALERWEQQQTTRVIEHLRTIDDPRARLRRLFELAFQEHADGDTNTALLADAANPLVGPVLGRVTQRRLAFLTQAFTDLGLAPDRASHRALVAYTAYVGYFELRRAAPAATPAGPGAAAYLDHLLRLLASG